MLAGLLALAVGGWLVWHFTSEAATRQGGAVAEIYYESKLVMTVDLTEHIDRRFFHPPEAERRLSRIRRRQHPL